MRAPTVAPDVLSLGATPTRNDADRALNRLRAWPPQAVTTSDDAARRPGSRRDDERLLADPRPAGLAERFTMWFVEAGQVGAGRADAAGVGLPPLVERRCSTSRRQLGPLDLAQAGRREQLDQVPSRAPASCDSSRAPGSSSSGRRPEEAERRLRPPAWSQTQAATTPPGRVTRAISRSPATGSVMKCTTSWASAASKASSSNGSASADADARRRRGSASGPRATNGSDGSTAATASAPEARDEFGGQRARSAPDVERRAGRAGPRRGRPAAPTSGTE